MIWLQRLIDVLTISFALITLNILLSVIGQSPIIGLVSLLLQIVAGIMLAFRYLIEIQRLPCRFLQYRGCFQANVTNSPVICPKETPHRGLSWQEQDVVKEIARKQIDIFA